MDVKRETTRKVLFLCTGNYYRSRFAEAYFRHVARRIGLDWEVDSAGFRLSSANVGPLSRHTIEYCQESQIPIDTKRGPRILEATDLESATVTIAVKEAEHRPMMRQRFPDWENRIKYWQIHDIDVKLPSESLPQLRAQIDCFIEEIFRNFQLGCGTE